MRELFEQEPPPPPRKTRAELMKDIDADYYGYRDDDDGILIPLETIAEERAREEAVAMWKKKKEDRLESGLAEEEDEEEDIYAQPKEVNIFSNYNFHNQFFFFNSTERTRRSTYGN